MPKVVDSMMKLFADDANIFKAVESMDDISIIQNDINTLLDWSHKWQLPLNIAKCKCIHFGKNNPNHSYMMGDLPLESDSEEKDVGVVFDPTLNFRRHINIMISKANQRVRLVKRTFSTLNTKNFKLIYKSLIRPTLEYCSSIWYPIFKTDATEIEKVQRRSTKLVPELKNLSYTDRLKHLDLTTLAYRRKRTDLIQTFKIINKIDIIPLDSFFTLNNNPTRGHKWKLDKPRAITSIRQNCFSHWVINWWNDLPREVADCKTINSFKNLIEKALKNDPIKFEFE